MDALSDFPFFRSLDQFHAAYPYFEITEEMRLAEARFPMALSRYYASLIERFDISDPIFAQCIPGAGELRCAPWLSADPLGENFYLPLPRLVHRYPDRALIITTSACAMYCRHCTRKRVSGTPDTHITPEETDAICEYLRQHPAVSDVLLSGGDPLMLSDDKLLEVLRKLRAVPSVTVIRLCSRVPVTLPQRITPALVSRISGLGGTFYLNTQFNHPREITPQSLEACRLFSDAGIPAASQTVLLRGVNDSAELLGELFTRLYHNRIRPYYLFQCDLVRGIEHFRTPIEKGLEIMKWLRAHISGMAIPNFCLDPPGHGGKIELSPDYFVEHTATHTVLKNGLGEIFRYPHPLP